MVLFGSLFIISKTTPTENKTYNVTKTTKSFDSVTVNETETSYNYTFYKKGKFNYMNIFEIKVDKRDNPFISKSSYALMGELKIEIKEGEENQYITDYKKNNYTYDLLYDNKITIILDKKTKIKGNKND
jgi:predicted ferric reductase